MHSKQCCVKEQLDKVQSKREEAELMRMYDLLDMKLIKYRDISEDTCMLVDEKVIHFSKEVRRPWQGRQSPLKSFLPLFLLPTFLSLPVPRRSGLKSSYEVCSAELPSESEQSPVAKRFWCISSQNKYMMWTNLWTALLLLQCLRIWCFKCL